MKVGAGQTRSRCFFCLRLQRNATKISVFQLKYLLHSSVISIMVRRQMNCTSTFNLATWSSSSSVDDDQDERPELGLSVFFELLLFVTAVLTRRRLIYKRFLQHLKSFANFTQDLNKRVARSSFALITKSPNSKNLFYTHFKHAIPCD